MSVKVDVWMPTYYMRLEAATVHLSDAEFRAYWRLIVHAWHTAKPLPNDAARLANIAHKSPAEWRRMRATVMAFFVLTDDGWTHAKVEKELAKARGHKVRAVAGGNAKAENGAKTPAKRGAKRVLNGCLNGAKSVLNGCTSPSPPIGGLIESPPDRGRDGSRSPHDRGAPVSPEDRAAVAVLMKGLGDELRRDGKVTALFPDGPPATASGR